MRVLVSAAGSHGDILPFIGLGKDLSRRGHDVNFYGNPVFSRYATDAGIRFVPVSTAEAYASLFADAIEHDPGKAFKRVAQEYAAIGAGYYEAMKADVIPGRTVAVSGSILFAPRLLRETSGVPCATVHLAPCMLRSNRQPARLAPRWIGTDTPALVKRLAWWLTDRFYDQTINAPLNQQRAGLGLAPVQRIFRSWIHEADCLIGMFPDWFAEPQEDWPQRLVLAGFPLYDHGDARPLPTSLDEFIEAGAPPVGISAGTATAAAHEFFKTSVAACEAAGLRAVLLSPFPDQIPAALPEGIIHVEYAPYGALLPRLAAFVHHGGIGTTSQALRAGVPQLIRPVAYDQFDNSARAVRLGVATELLPKRYTASAVASALRTLATDGRLRQRCREMSTRLTEGNAIVAASDAIEAMAGRALA